MSRPKLLGVTGGIGSGKSTVCKVFETLGCKCYYADDRAKYLMEHSRNVVSEVVNIFGSGAYKEGRLNRQVVSNKVFHDKSLLNRLNKVVHPAVKDDFIRWIEQNQKDRILLKEAALLFETKSYQELDQTVLVLANKETRVQRVLRRDPHRSEEEIKAIIDKQLPDSKKEAMADFIIKNDENELLTRQVVDVFDKVYA